MTTQELLHLHFAHRDDPAEFLRDFAESHGLAVDGAGRALRAVGAAPEWLRLEVIVRPWGVAAHLSGDYKAFSDALITALTARYGQVVIEER